MFHKPLAFAATALGSLSAMCGSGGGAAAAPTLETESYLGDAVDPQRLFRWTPLDPGAEIEVQVEVQNAPDELPAGLVALGYDSQRCAQAVRDGLDDWARHSGQDLEFDLALHGDGETLSDGAVCIEVSFDEVGGGALEGFTEVLTMALDRSAVARVAVRIEIGVAAKELSGDMVYALLLHEFGHALGIVAPAPFTGHSDRARDVMFPTVRWTELSSDDRLAIRELYRLDPTMVRAAAARRARTGVGDGGGWNWQPWLDWRALRSDPARVAGAGRADPAAGPRCTGCAAAAGR